MFEMKKYNGCGLLLQKNIVVKWKNIAIKTIQKETQKEKRVLIDDSVSCRKHS